VRTSPFLWLAGGRARANLRTKIIKKIKNFQKSASKRLTSSPESGIIKVQKGWRYSKMKEYKILVGNKASVVKDLEYAKWIAKNASVVNFRASVFCGNERVAHYEWGKEI
jgi:hypothetical protein